MARINVTHTLRDLEQDMVKVTRTTAPKMAKVVKRNTRQGRSLARKFARSASGPHGKNYYKRITDEMLSPLTGEYGPHGGGTPVGGGWRTGPGNTDLAKSADIQGPKFAKDVGETLDSVFWP